MVHSETAEQGISPNYPSWTQPRLEKVKAGFLPPNSLIEMASRCDIGLSCMIILSKSCSSDEAGCLWRPFNEAGLAPFYFR